MPIISADGYHGNYVHEPWQRVLRLAGALRPARARLARQAGRRLRARHVVRKELRLIGVRGHDLRSVVPAIELIRSDRCPLHLLCTHAFGLDEADRALRVAGARLDREAIHVSIVP